MCVWECSHEPSEFTKAIESKTKVKEEELVEDELEESSNKKAKRK